MTQETKEKNNICKFIKCLGEKKYAEANKYLQETVNSKLTSRMEQVKNKPIFKT